ncbi:MAG: hypothetical protein HXY30_08265 [Pseudorhodoplanes sp.]|nr:hypothetical protein [Pseudorhodoplanes sp.]
MTSIQWVPTLMFVTLTAAVLFGVLQLLSFLRRRSNRQAAEQALVGSGTRSDVGAFPEIAGIGAIALVVMGLLTFAYNAGSGGTRSVETPPSAATPASATDQMTAPARPRVNPAEMSQPPTQYPLGSGSPNSAPTNPAPADRN